MSFWLDEGNEGGKLEQGFPMIYSLACNKETTAVKSFFGSFNDSVWVVDLVRNLNDKEVNEYVKLFSVCPNT